MNEVSVYDPEEVDIFAENYEFMRGEYDFENCATARDTIGPIYKQDVVAALSATMGSVNSAANLLNRARGTLVRWLKANPEINQLATDLEEGVLDDVEAGLRVQARAGDPAQMRYLLSTKGKSRGYTTRVEQDVSGSMAFNKVAEVRIGEAQMLRIAKEIVARTGLSNAETV